MLKLDFNGTQLIVVQSRFEQLAERARKVVLKRVGDEAAKLNLKALKQEVVPEVSETLRKSWGKKVQVYPRAGRVWAVAGPRSKKTFISAYEYYRKYLAKHGIVHQEQGPRKPQDKPLNPAHYAHLAGPKREGRSVYNVRFSQEKTTKQVIEETLKKEIFKL